MNTKLIPLLVLACGALAAAELPLLSWDFNEGGGDHAASQGSAGEANLYLKSRDGGTPPFSADAQGPSGKSGDYAFDLSSSTGMGATTPNSVGPVGVVWSNGPGLSGLSGLSSFTITGWINPAANVNHAARIVVAGPVALMAGTVDRLTLQVNGVSADVQSEPAYDRTGQWMFIAVTYDGTRDSGNVTYYVGDASANSLAKAGVATLPAGRLKPFSGQLLVGNNSVQGDTTRPFKGLIDNLAIHGSKDDASGALLADKLEAIRAGALR